MLADQAFAFLPSRGCDRTFPSSVFAEQALCSALEPSPEHPFNVSGSAKIHRLTFFALFLSGSRSLIAQEQNARLFSADQKAIIAATMPALIKDLECSYILEGRTNDYFISRVKPLAGRPPAPFDNSPFIVSRLWSHTTLWAAGALSLSGFSQQGQTHVSRGQFLKLLTWVLSLAAIGLITRLVHPFQRGFAQYGNVPPDKEEIFISSYLKDASETEYALAHEIVHFLRKFRAFPDHSLYADGYAALWVLDRYGEPSLRKMFQKLSGTGMRIQGRTRAEAFDLGKKIFTEYPNSPDARELHLRAKILERYPGRTFSFDPDVVRDNEVPWVYEYQTASGGVAEAFRAQHHGDAKLARDYLINRMWRYSPAMAENVALKKWQNRAAEGAKKDARLRWLNRIATRAVDRVPLPFIAGLAVAIVGAETIPLATKRRFMPYTRWSLFSALGSSTMFLYQLWGNDLSPWENGGLALVCGGLTAVITWMALDMTDLLLNPHPPATPKTNETSDVRIAA